MELQDIKRWQWMVVGLLAGLALSFAFSDHDVNAGVIKDNEIKQAEFERDAFSRSRLTHEPVLQDIVVEPAVQDFQSHTVQLVKGQRLRYSEKYNKEYRVPFMFYADLPYTPVNMPFNSPTPAGKTVIDFLSVAKQVISPAAASTNQPAPAVGPWQGAVPIRFRFGWEYTSKWNRILWAAGGLIFIGGLWPTFINAMVGAGLGKAPKAEREPSYLDRFGKGKPEKAASVRRTTMDDAERQRLDELNAALASGLAPSGAVHAFAATTEAPESTIAAFAAGNADPPSISAPVHEVQEMTEEERKKRYATGDFYPVARGKSDQKPKQ